MRFLVQRTLFTENPHPLVGSYIKKRSSQARCQACKASLTTGRRSPGSGGEGHSLPNNYSCSLRRTAHPELRIKSVKGCRIHHVFDPRVWRWLGWLPMRPVSRAWEAEVLPLNYTRARARFYETAAIPGNRLCRPLCPIITVAMYVAVDPNPPICGSTGLPVL